MLGRRGLLRLAGLGFARSGFARSGFAGSGLASPALTRFARAETYPSRPLRWIVPFSPGGATDLVARWMAQWLTGRLGQQVIIENKPGGGTNIGVQAAVAAAPDGYTLLLTLVTNAINPWLYKSLPFDFQRDIVAVAGLTELPLVLDVNPGFPAQTLPELISYAKANPGKIDIASFGARTISDLAIQLLAISAGIDVVRVPYPGGAPMLTDLMTGRVQAGVDALPNSLPHIRAGAVRAMAILSARRTPVLPDVPIVAETISGFEVKPWIGVGVPRGTPADIVTRLNREINAGLADPNLKAQLAGVGGVPLVYSPDQFAALVTRDTAKWGDVVKRAGLKPE